MLIKSATCFMSNNTTKGIFFFDYVGLDFIPFKDIKKIKISSDIGLLIETLLISPIAIALFLVLIKILM